MIQSFSSCQTVVPTTRMMQHETKNQKLPEVSVSVSVFVHFLLFFNPFVEPSNCSESTVESEEAVENEEDPLLASLISTLSDCENMDMDCSLEDWEDQETGERARKKAMDDLLGKWNCGITSDCKVTVGEFLTEFLKATSKWNVVNKCISHMLRLIHKIVKPDVEFPPSLDVLKDKLRKKKLLTDPESHNACHLCGNFVQEMEIDKKKCFRCDYCSLEENEPVIHQKCLNFAYIPITPSIKLGLQSGLFKDVSHFRGLFNENEGFRKSFLDGVVCRDFVEQFGENVLFINLNSDSGRSAKSTQASKWILQHCVLQPGQWKPQPKMNTLFYKGTAEDELMENGWVPQLYNTLYEKLIDELKVLSTTGISYTFDNIQRNVKVLVLSHNMDSVERYPILGIRHFTAAFGCTGCLYDPGVSQVYKRRIFVNPPNGKRTDPRDPDLMKTLVRKSIYFRITKSIVSQFL